MIETLNEELYIDDGGRTYHEVPGHPDQPLVEAGKMFELDLCRKQTSMGNVPVDQFWIDRRLIYGDGRQAARTRQSIIAIYWALCWRESSVFEDEVEDSYIFGAPLSVHAKTAHAGCLPTPRLSFPSDVVYLSGLASRNSMPSSNSSVTAVWTSKSSAT